MRLGRLESKEGQTLAEYAIIIAAVAVGCAMVVLFLGGGIRGFFDTSKKPIAPGRVSPVHGTPFGGPKTIADCQDGGWVIYNYSSLEECEEAVEAGSSD